MKKILTAYWPLLLILVIAGIFFTFRLGRDLLWDWDECLYGQYAKEMKQTGHYLTNVWNGHIDLQKPPLYTWLLQLPTSLGLNEFTMRILSAISGLGLLTALYVFTKKYFSQIVAILATLLLLSGELIVIYSMKANTDVIYSLFIFLGVFSWIASYKKSRLSYLAGLFFGLAVMVKGLGSTQFLLALFVALFLDFKKERLYNFLKMIGVFILVIAPWHLIAYSTYGYEFFRVYILENIIKRSKYPIEFHRERWYFYFVLIYKELFPWIFTGAVFPLTYLKNLKVFTSLKKLREEFTKRELLFTIILLVIVPLALITRVHTRIAWYAMPLYSFLSIYLAYNIELFGKLIRFQKIVWLFVILIAFDAFRLLSGETRILQSQREVAPRYEVMLKTRKHPQKELEYLVAFSERQAREILPPEEQIPQTWVFGGNPCAVYYSDKKVHYYYEVDDFTKRLQKGKGLFLIENGDLKLVEGIPVKGLFNNSEYTLFSY